MIEKIISIKNITKFHDFNHVGNIEFRPLTLVYAENGKGKSTIAAIFRSLTSGDPSPITSKQTIGVQAAPFVKIKHSGGISEFREQAWTQPVPDLIVFDSYYVTSNIFSGDFISHGHKKNLYYLIIGEKSVEFAQRIEELDTEIREIGKQFQDIEKDIKRNLFGNISIDAFLRLQSLDNIGVQIEQQEAVLDSLKRSLEIKSTPALSPVMLPVLDLEAIENLLRITIDEISNDAESKFRHHCDGLGENGEAWIRNGIEFSQKKDGICPYCGQDTSQSELIILYRQYFNERYTALKNEIQEHLKLLEDATSSNVVINIQKQIVDNATRSSFWSSYVEGNFPEFDFASIKTAIDRFVEQIKILLNRKHNTPLERIYITDDLIAAANNYGKVSNALSSYNAEVDNKNVLIERKKEDVQVQSFDSEQEKLIFLQNTKVRFEPFMMDLCDRYQKLLSKRDSLTQEKASTREQLDAETVTVMGQYQELLNKLLENFGAEFRIHRTQTSLQGGKPSISYSLLINGENIPLGSEDTLDKPSFKTTLSDGEKNSLAFAFFLAQVLHNPALANKTIIIDDPITSLDEQRRLCTKHEILKVASKAKQVIVLSHDPMFLKSINDDCQNPKSLIIKRSQNGSIIEEWDIESATQSRHQKNYAKLKRYLDESEGELIDVALCIRPVLEGYLRVRFPDEFTPKEWLGNFIDKIRAAADTDPLGTMKGKLEELANINDFSKRFHHETDANYSANRDNVTDAELQPWVRRTIEFIRSA